MLLLDRYILQAFSRPLIYGSVLFTGVMVITELFRRFSQLMAAKVSLWITIKYFACKLPLTISLISPMAVLLACLFSLSSLLRHYEITAFKASGVSLYRIFRPILLVSLGLSFILFWWNEAVVPPANQEAERIKCVEIQKQQTGQMKIFDLSFKSSQGWFVNVRLFDRTEGVLEGVEMKSCYPDGSVLVRIDAKKARWTKEQSWLLLQGIERKFDQKGGIIREEDFKKKKLKYLAETPAQIWYLAQAEKRDSSSMRMRELLEYIQLLERSGSRVEEKLVDLHLKMAMPFANVIIALIGMSLALQRPRGGGAASFGLSILISFLYWGGIGVGRAMGYADKLPPFLAAWLANFIFGLVGIYLAVRAKK